MIPFHDAAVERIYRPLWRAFKLWVRWAFST